MAEEDRQLMERRRFIRGAATVAWATPIILTLSAQGASASHTTCIALGSRCGTGSPNPTRPCCESAHSGVDQACCCQYTASNLQVRNECGTKTGVGNACTVTLPNATVMAGTCIQE